MKTTSLYQKKETLVQLGTIFHSLVKDGNWPGYSIGLNENEYNDFKSLLPTLKNHNGWFSYDMIIIALNAWANAFKMDNLSIWLNKYSIDNNSDAKKVAIICAGNIPMVGFHDIICGYISGHSLLIKLSSDDAVLIPAVIELMSKFDDNIINQISFVSTKLKDFNAVIATGSNNTSRYFNDYFSKYPNIIRKSRTSVAVLNGEENDEQLVELAKDVFTYYGLGCRNVTKLFLPAGYDLNKLFKAFFFMQDVINNNKYANNYDYHKAIFLLDKFEIIENGFLILKEDKEIFSPIGTLYYEFYNQTEEVNKILSHHENQIQCIVGLNGVPFGKAQEPFLWDYADNIDTLNFLNKL